MKITKKAFALLLLSGVLGMSACGVMSTEPSNNGNNNQTTEPNGNNGNGNNGGTSTTSNGGTSASSNGGNTSSRKDPAAQIAAAKEAFKKLDNLSDFSANIQNAASLGLSRPAKGVRALRQRLEDGESDGEFETTQTLVKTTTSYDAGEATVEGGELNVTFTKVDTTVKTEHIQGRKNLYASLKGDDNDEVIVEEYGDDAITFKSDDKHEYRVLDRDGEVVYDWAPGQKDQTTTGKLHTRKEWNPDDYEIWYKEVYHYRANNTGNTNNVTDENGINWYTYDSYDDISYSTNWYWDDEKQEQIEERNYYFWAQKDRVSYSASGENQYYYQYRVLDITNPRSPEVLVDWKSYYPEGEDLSEEWGSMQISLDFDDIETRYTKIKVQTKQGSKYIPYDEEPKEENNNSENNENNGHFLQSAKNAEYGTPGQLSFYCSRSWVDPDDEEHYRQNFYCLKDKEGNIVIDWVENTGDGTDNDWCRVTFEYEYEEPISSRSYTVEARSIDAVVTYPAYEGFTYTLLDKDGRVIVDGVTASSELNVSTDKESLVVFDGLKEGEKYVLKYEGYGEETTTEQSKVGGEIDKMYVYNEQFTFVSFVPYGTSKRPSDDELLYEKDGIANYDRRDYYSDENRLSFIFDNYSGYIYLIEGFHVKYIHNNLLLSGRANDNFVYDFKINDNNDLEIYALFNNEAVNYFNFFKDKHGNKVIQNDRLDEYDPNTNTYYFVSNCNSDELTRIMTAGEFSSVDQIWRKANSLEYKDNNWEEVDRERQNLYRLADSINNRNNGSVTNVNDNNIRYYLTNTNEILYIEYFNNYERAVKNAYLIIDESAHRDLTVRDQFMNVTSCSWDNEVIKCSSGYLMTMSMNYQTFYNNDEKGYQTQTKALYGTTNYVFFLNLMTLHGARSYEYAGETGNYFDVTYLASHDTFLIYNKKAKGLYEWTFEDIASSLTNTWNYYSSNPEEDLWSRYNSEFKFMEGARRIGTEEMTLDDTMNSFVKYNVNGTQYFDVVVEDKDKDGKLEFSTYETGTYEAEQIKIVLQPINR